MSSSVSYNELSNNIFLLLLFVGSIDPSQLQVSLEQTQGAPSTPRKSFKSFVVLFSTLITIDFFLWVTEANRSSGKSSPLRGRCVKEYEEQLQQLQHENFNLKLRVFLLEERVGKALGRSDAADIIKNNIELKVENETLKKSLAEKCQLLAQASGAIEELENQQKSSLAAHQLEKISLHQQLEQLQKVNFLQTPMQHVQVVKRGYLWFRNWLRPRRLE